MTKMLILTILLHEKKKFSFFSSLKLLWRGILPPALPLVPPLNIQVLQKKKKKKHLHYASVWCQHLKEGLVVYFQQPSW